MNISRQIGWGTESNLLYQILKQITRLTSIMFSLKPNYKVFTALVSQDGGNDPILVILENTIGDVTTNYRALGQYDINLPANIPLTSKIFINNTSIAQSSSDSVFNRIINIDGNGDFNVQKGYYFLYQGNNTLRLYTLSDVNVFADSIIITPICVEIRVYN